MIFKETKLPGAFVIEPEKIEDERGFFARAWCKEEFAAHGLEPRFVQFNLAGSEKAGTLRGLHYQAPPHQEARLVRCTKGAIYDVIVDLRSDSPMRGQWIGTELTARNHRMLYIPAGFAHGYQTLADHSEVFYSVTAFYAPEAERGLRYDDPAFDIEWPREVQAISEKDRQWEKYEERSAPGSSISGNAIEANA
jgi:dTDP-4-dehydrorhamnose 3,5-epimerase